MIYFILWWLSGLFLVTFYTYKEIQTGNDFYLDQVLLILFVCPIFGLLWILMLGNYFDCNPIIFKGKKK